MTQAFKKSTVKRGYGYLAIKLLSFFILIFIADAAVGGLLKYFFQKESSGWDYRTRYAMEQTNADIIVFGSSRAQHSYHPEIFQKELNLTCFNAGRDGESILYSYAVLQSILKRNQPKIAILDCEVDMFSVNDYSYERISCLLPYYSTHPEIRSILNLRSPYEKIKMLSKIYPYNSLLFNIIIGNTEMNKQKHQDINGYIALFNELSNLPADVTYTTSYKTDSVKTKILHSFIADCKKANIKLFFVCSPYLNKMIGTETSIQVLQNAAKQNNIPYIDFTNDTFFVKRPNMFDDTAHVNSEGSKIFSTRVAEIIKK